MEPFNSKKITQSSGSNFAASFLFLPKEKKEALTAIYAYCRLSDDCVDCASSIEEGQKKLSDWRKELARCFKEKSQNPVLHDIALTASRFCIPEIYFYQLLDGMQMDLEKNCYASFAELYTYCYHAASVVGLICIEIFEYQNPQSKEYAVNLGIAFQLTNILRDIKTDAERGRVYIPEEDLAKFNLKREDVLLMTDWTVLPVEKINSLKELIDFECNRANYYYKKSRENLDRSDRKNFVAAEMMTAVYHSILKKIKREPFLPFISKIKLSKPEKIFRIFQGWITHLLKL